MQKVASSSDSGDFTIVKSYSDSSATSRASTSPSLSDSSSSDEYDLSRSSNEPSIKRVFDKGHQYPVIENGLTAATSTHLAAKNVSEYIDQVIRSGEEQNSFVVTNLAKVISQFELWKRELPFVEPFYAVKCYPNEKVVECLSDLGCGFDCASMGEIRDVANILKSSQKQRQKIVYAQPAKMEDHLRYALRNGVSLMVFDGEDELIKIAETLAEEVETWETGQRQRRLKAGDGTDNTETHLKPEAHLLLRVATSDSESVCQFSNKFGCDAKKDGPYLLEVAQRLGLYVAGVSFHVGSGCGDAAAYAHAIADVESIFLCARRMGMPHMTVIDIGGGMPGDPAAYYKDGTLPTFEDLACTIRHSVASFEHRLGEVSAEWVPQLRYIAEPGRFFVSASTTVATRVYSRKDVGPQRAAQALYVDDGFYGTFNNVVYDHYQPATPQLLGMGCKLYPKSAAKARCFGVGGEGDDEVASDEKVPTAIFGPTCDGLDQLCDARSCSLPRTEIGDWLLWPCMGAYTHTASFVFNGYDHVPNTHVVNLP